jgi:hypothetical protein
MILAKWRRATDALQHSLTLRLWNDRDRLSPDAEQLAIELAAKPGLALRYLEEAAAFARDLSRKQGLRLKRICSRSWPAPKSAEPMPRPSRREAEPADEVHALEDGHV